MPTTIKDFRKAAVGLIASIAFAGHQSLALASPIEQEDYSVYLNPDYLGFVQAVQKFKWHEGLEKLGLASERNVIMLTYNVMTHPGKPANFSLADLGVPGCGLPGGGGDRHGVTACHAICREEEHGDVCLKKGPKVA